MTTNNLLELCADAMAKGTNISRPDAQMLVRRILRFLAINLDEVALEEACGVFNKGEYNSGEEAIAALIKTYLSQLIKDKADA